MSEELKPCPFCGSTRVFIERDYPPSENPALDNEWVECLRCGATGPWHTVTRSHRVIISAWNRRVE